MNRRSRSKIHLKKYYYHQILIKNVLAVGKQFFYKVMKKQVDMNLLMQIVNCEINLHLHISNCLISSDIQDLSM